MISKYNPTFEVHPVDYLLIIKIWNIWLSIKKYIIFLIIRLVIYLLFRLPIFYLNLEIFFVCKIRQD